MPHRPGTSAFKVKIARCKLSYTQSSINALNLALTFVNRAVWSDDELETVIREKIQVRSCQKASSVLMFLIYSDEM